MPESSQPWTWPPDRALTIYHWSWFDPAAGDVVAGWSQRGETNDRDYIHLEAERGQDPRTVQVYKEGYPSVEPHTFSAMYPLPSELRLDDGRPLPWIIALIGKG